MTADKGRKQFKWVSKVAMGCGVFIDCAFFCAWSLKEYLFLWHIYLVPLPFRSRRLLALEQAVLSIHPSPIQQSLWEPGDPD